MEKVSSIVIKIGSSSVVGDDFAVNKKNINSLLHSISKLRERGINTALVTSGAIACGMHELGITKKIKLMSLRQACAAVGQSRLMLEYNKIASIYSIKTGQILVNHDDFKFPHRMKCLHSTLEKMFEKSVLPIINENDALAVEEIKLGDNDTLASLIAPLVHAELVVLFSDIDGLYDKDPKAHSDAKLISDIYSIDDKIRAASSGAGSLVGTGGMSTKIISAQNCMANGIDMIICNSKRLDELEDIVLKRNIGTLFHSPNKR